jgi:hypothetical protein
MKKVEEGIETFKEEQELKKQELLKNRKEETINFLRKNKKKLEKKLITMINHSLGYYEAPRK